MSCTLTEPSWGYVPADEAEPLDGHGITLITSVYAETPYEGVFHWSKHQSSVGTLIRGAGGLGIEYDDLLAHSAGHCDRIVAREQER